MNTRTQRWMSVMCMTICCMSACTDLERSKTPTAEPLPPLQPLGAYRVASSQGSTQMAPSLEPPSYSPEEAETFEQGLIEHFEETGRIPLPEVPQGADTEREDEEPLIPENLLEQDVDPEALAAEEKRRKEEIQRNEALKNDPSVVGYKDPELLVAKVFTSILSQDNETFDKLFIDSTSLSVLVGLSDTKAQERVARLRKSSYEVMDLFAVKNPSQEYADGLKKILRVKEVKLGTASTLKGKTPRDGESPVQYWGNTVTFEWANPHEKKKTPNIMERTFTPAVFTMTVPRLLRIPGGGWKISESPHVSPRFYTWLRAGLHFKPEMMSPEHHPYPMSVGNFWRYRVTSPEQKPSLEDDPMGISAPSTTPRESDEVRLEVRDVVRYPGYRVATLQRTYTDRKKSTTEYLLVTPKMVFPCGRYCKSRAGSMEYVLEFIRQNTPILVFPLHEGAAWGFAGHKAASGGRMVTLPKRASVKVPAGNFEDVVVIEPRTRAGNNAWYFKESLGFVRREHRGNTGARFEELIRSRVLNAE